jgi:hypothetical protein
MGARYLEHPERIDVNPAVVIGVAMGDPSGEEARRVNSPRVGRCVVGGGPSAGVPALAPGVHAEVGPAGLGPDGVGMRVPPAARVAVVLDDRRQWTSSSGWYVQPGPHWSPAVPGEGHVVRVDQCQLVVDLGRRCGQVEAARCIDRVPPEIVEVRWLVNLRPILPKLI